MLNLTIEELGAALQPLIKIADAYDENALDAEARKFFGKDAHFRNHYDPAEVELYCGRGGRQLLTLAQCLQARELWRRLKGENKPTLPSGG